MNISNLSVGLIAKSYKHMCEILEEDVKAGNSKVAQLSEWNRYFSYHKDGNKFITDEVYEVVKSKEDSRTNGNNSVFGEHIQKLILDLLSQDANKGHLFLSCNQLLLKLQMVNVNYAKGRSNIPKLSEILKIDGKIVKDVYDFTHNKLKSSLESSLNTLSKQSWIEWHKKKTVCINNIVLDKNEIGQPKLNKHNQITYTVTPEYREATLEEVQYIIGEEGLLMDEMGCKDKRELMIKNKMEHFRNRINKQLKEKYNIEFYYESYEIITNKDILVKRLNRLDKTEAFNELNDKVLESSYKSIENKNKNAIDKINNHNPLISTIHDNNPCFIRYRDDYVCSSNSVVDKIIDRKARKINDLENRRL